MKVFGGLVFRRGVNGSNRVVQVRVVVAVPSRAALGRVLDAINHHASRGELRDYWSETGNPDDIAAAMSEPGTVFWRPLDDWRSPHVRWEPQS